MVYDKSVCDQIHEFENIIFDLKVEGIVVDFSYDELVISLRIETNNGENKIEGFASKAKAKAKAKALLVKAYKPKPKKNSRKMTQIEINKTNNVGFVVIKANHLARDCYQRKGRTYKPKYFSYEK